MIEGILNYIQSFLVLFLLIKVLLFLIPKSSFAKYISFFSGVILVLGVLHPMLSFFHLEEDWRKTFYAATFEKQALEASINVAKFTDDNGEFYNQQMKVLIEEEMKKQMQLAGIAIKEVDVSLNRDYQLDNIRVVVLKDQEEGNTQLLECLQKTYHLSAAQYEIVYE